MIVPVEADIAQVMDMPGHWVAVTDEMPHIVGFGEDEDEATRDLIEKLNSIMFH